jgi:hypothetical protein
VRVRLREVVWRWCGGVMIDHGGGGGGKVGLGTEAEIG